MRSNKKKIEERREEKKKNGDEEKGRIKVENRRYIHIIFF